MEHEKRTDANGTAPAGAADVASTERTITEQTRAAVVLLRLFIPTPLLVGGPPRPPVTPGFRHHGLLSFTPSGESAAEASCCAGHRPGGTVPR